jgi:hypothetical protein
MIETLPVASPRLVEAFGARRRPGPADGADHGSVHRAVAGAGYPRATLVGSFAGLEHSAPAKLRVLHQQSPEAAMAAKGGTQDGNGGPAPSEQQGEWK